MLLDIQAIFRLTLNYKVTVKAFHSFSLTVFKSMKCNPMHQIFHGLLCFWVFIFAPVNTAAIRLTHKPYNLHWSAILGHN